MLVEEKFPNQEINKRMYMVLPSSSHQILGLDLACPHLSIFGTLLDILHELLFLVFELDPLTVEFTLRFFEGTLVFAQTLLGRHALSEGPFDDL